MCKPEAAETVRATLDEAFTRLDALFLLAPDDLLFRPDHADAWSILEHLEHVSLANHYLLLTIGKGCRAALRRAAAGRPVPGGESDLEALAPVAVPGAFEWPPPAHMVPTGSRTAAELRLELARQHGECLALLASMPEGEGRLYLIRMSVHGLGRLDMYQWLYFLVQHARYHLKMMETVARLRRDNERERSACLI